MPLFRKKAEAAAVEAEPATSWETKRHAQLESEIETLREKLADVNGRIAGFLKRNTVIIDGRRCLRADSIVGRSSLDLQLQKLQQERDRLLGLWHSTLAAHAELTVPTGRRA